MSIDIRVEVKAEYVQLSCRGTFALEAVLDVYRQAFDAAIREGRNAVLVDFMDLQGMPPTTLDRYEQGVHVAQLQQDPARRRIRIVVVGHEPLIDPQRFGETVALNRGAIGKVFTDMEEAVAWIRTEGQP